MARLHDKIVDQPVSEEGSFDVPPAALGRFRVLHQIGAGTLGPVFRATDPGSDTVVAVKLLNINLFPQDAARVARDLGQLAATLPRLAAAVTPIEAGQENHVPFLATTLADGDSLDVALREFGPAAIADLLPRVEALAATLDEAASREVYHGALHPRDIMVAEHDTRLTGLGIVPILGRHGVPPTVRRPYAAPELADGQYSGEADQYALAALTYEWMTGRKANGPATEVPALPGVNRAAMAEAFARAFHDDPAERFDSCASFVEAVKDAAGDTATMAEAGPGLAAAAAPAPVRQPRTRRSRHTLPLDDFPEEGDAEQPTESSEEPEPETREAAEEFEEPDDSEEEEPEELEYLDADTRAAEAAAGAARTSIEDDEPALGGDTPAERFTSIDVPHIGRDPRQVPIAAHDRLGSLPVVAPPILTTPPERSGGGTRILIAALVGIGLGIAGGYYVWGIAGAPFMNEMVIEDVPASGPSSDGPAEGGAESAPGGGSDAAGAAGPAASQSPGSAGAPRVGAAQPADGGPAAAAGKEGRLLIRSTPPGATVLVDGEMRGLTPLSLTDLPLGNRRIRVQRDGYLTQDRTVSLTRQRPSRSVDVPLLRRQAAPAAGAGTAARSSAPAARTGSLLVESRPSGATVTVNGTVRGTTPITLSGLAPGQYTVQLQLTGYRTITTTVRVVAGERARAAASLTEQERE